MCILTAGAPGHWYCFNTQYLHISVVKCQVFLHYAFGENDFLFPFIAL